MLKLVGTLEVFKNRNGFVTGVIKAWDNEAKKVLGKAYLDVVLPEDVEIKEGQTLTLNVTEGYLNSVYIDVENPFTKLRINVVSCEVKSIFPAETKKVSKKGNKSAKSDLPF